MKRTEVTNQELIDVLNWAAGENKLTVDASTVRNAEGDPEANRELVSLDDSDCRIRWDPIKNLFVIKDATYSDHPAVMVTWYGALAWCNYRSDMDGYDRCYSFDDWSCDWSKNGYRLPTEAEWEYACRQGTSTALNNGKNLTYAGSEPLDPNLDSVGWYSANSASSTHEVGGKLDADGLFDMHGNVEEWCWDWFGSYPSGVQTDPRGPTSAQGPWGPDKSNQVGRGGSWAHTAAACRSAFRYGGGWPGFGRNNLGFRSVRYLDP